MKERIGDYLGLSIHDFIIKKSSHYGDELNMLSDSLYKFDSDFVNIYVEFGKPLGEGNIALKLDEIKVTGLYCANDYTKFKIYPYVIQEFGSFTLDINKSINEIKEMLCEELEKSRKIKLNKDFVLVREHLIDKPSKIFPEDETIRNLNFNKGKRIILQEYKKKKLVSSLNQIQITVREYDPSNWSMSEPIEILVEKKSTVESLITNILRNFPEIKRENLSAQKLTTTYNLYLEDFNDKIKFDNLAEKANVKIDSFPYFLNNDGSIFIIKDSSKLCREPTESERKLFCRPAPVMSSEGNSTALVAVTENNNDSTKGESSETTVKNMMSKFENLIVNPLASLWNSAAKSGLFKTKEEGIKINVKKVNGEERKE